MQVHTVDDKVFRGKSVESNNFKIKATGKAFKALSSSLYNRKIRAIAREVMTNALDGHIANGNPEQQFDVSIPNKIFPQFVVRDYGTGMDHEMVMEQYTVYFASTKDDSNDEVGGFGLGCKSPFSYTSSFQVKSFQNGVLRVYSCYMNANGEPSVDLQLETSTEEPNGVEVTVPVREQDFQRFRDEVAFVISSFEVKPNVSVEPSYTLNRVNNEIFYANNHELTNVNVRMGNVVYPIRDNTEVITALNSTKMRQNLSGQIILDFKVGEVPVAMSREDLEYEPWVVDYLCKRIKEIDENLTKEVEDLYELVKSEPDGFEQMEEKYSFVKSMWNDKEFINPIPYTTKLTKRSNVGSHFSALMEAPLYQLDMLMKGEIDSIYDDLGFDDEQKKNIPMDKERNIPSLLTACNSVGTPRKLVSRYSMRVTKLEFPNPFTDYDSLTIYKSKRGVSGLVKNHHVEKPYSFSGNYIAAKPERIDYIKPYLDFLFGDKIVYEDLIDLKKANRIPRPKQMYRTYLIDFGHWSRKAETLDYSGSLQDAIDEIKDEFGDVIWYCTHNSKKPEIPNHINLNRFEDKLDLMNAKVLLIPKRYKKEIKNYQGEKRLVHFKHLIYGIINRYKRPRNLVSDDGYDALKWLRKMYIDSYKGDDLNYVDNASDIERFILESGKPFGDKRLRRLYKRYRNIIDTNDRKVISYKEEILKKNPILKFIKESYYFSGDESKELKDIIKGMMK